MSLFTSSLNSGSNGNCYYVGNAREAVMVDAGLSCRETEKRMARLGLSMQQVKAIFISHEHSDHIRGLEVMSRKHQIPVYINEATLRSGRLNLNSELVHEFKAHEAVVIGGLSVIPFPKEHDAADPYSFIVKGNGVNIGVLTDIGTVCERVIRYFKQCHAAYLEANYDVTMLEDGHYPIYLKRRISGDKGHLSNHQALELFKKHRAAHMSHVFLSHLSKENNSPQLAADLFNTYADDIHVVVASRYKETPLFCISPDKTANEAAEASIAILPGVQTSLF
jgi:phosphoribosyl 1,2-cyclic phosphodiesterase